MVTPETGPPRLQDRSDLQPCWFADDAFWGVV